MFAYFCCFRDEGIFAKNNHRLMTTDREQTGREAALTSATAFPYAVSAIILLRRIKGG